VSFDYLYNDANQRTRRTDPDGSYWLYEYDKLGQLTSGKHYWLDGNPVAGQQFEYAFDDIGNRTSTKEGGDSTGADLRSATYGANALNQYTNRTVPGGSYAQRKDKECTPIMLDPCLNNIDLFVECIEQYIWETAQNPPIYHAFGLLGDNCVTWLNRGIHLCIQTTLNQ